MSVVFIGGVPGSGKTLFATYLAKKKFKKENLFKKNKRINNVFSNYPIQLTNYFSKRKKYKKQVVRAYDENGNLQRKVNYVDRNVYSRKVSIMDFNTYKRHIPDSVYIFDEFHAVCDSLEYKNFPRKIQKTFQFHRHFGIKDIYVICQHPSRLVKQVRVLCDEFYKIKKFIKIPFIGICLFKYSVYYNFEDYGKSTKVKKEECMYDFENKIRIFKYKKIFKSYDTKYMKALVEEENYFESIPYATLNLTLDDIKNNFDMVKDK